LLFFRTQHARQQSVHDWATEEASVLQSLNALGITASWFEDTILTALGRADLLRTGVVVGNAQ
jgi:hypothetical protein